MNQPSRAAIYARVSTDEQARDGTSLATQLERCRAFITARGWTPVGEYVDEGISGTRSSRPALDRLMNECRNNNIDSVVFAKFDRFSRNRRHLENATAELDDLGIALVSVSENIDGSTATGQAFRALLGVFANLERDMIVERTTSGLRAVAQAGFWPGGPPPYGFRIIKEGPRSKLAIHETEAEMLRLAIDLLLDEGKSTQEAALTLNARGLKPRRSARWSAHSLRYTLVNCTLSGSWSWSRPGRRKQRNAEIHVSIPAIITPEREEELRRRLRSTSTIRRRSNTYLLNRGRLLAPCGDRFFGVFSESANRRLYRCYASLHENARPNRITQRCECRRVDADRIEELVWEQVCSFLGNDDVLERLIRQYGSEISRVTSAEVDPLEKRLTSIEKALERAYRQRFEATTDTATLDAIISEYEGELTELRASLANRDTDADPAVDLDALLANVGELKSLAREELPKLDEENRRRIIDLMQIETTVVGWNTCSLCFGTGRMSGSVTKLGGHSCSNCFGLRAVPAVRLSGVVFESLVDGLQGMHAATPAGMPFIVEAPIEPEIQVMPARRAKRTRWTTEEIEQLRTLVSQGYSNRAIASILRRGEVSVSTARSRLGRFRPRTRQPKTGRTLWSESERDALLGLLADGKSLAVIANELDRSVGAVKQYMRRNSRDVKPR